MELIDREALKEELDQNYVRNEYCPYDAIEDIIDSVPTIEERKTGKWIVITKMDGRTLYECSVCGKRVIYDDLMDLPNYCDHCGAKMEGAEEDAE